jgi:CO dehydrogenase maturation factor
VTSLRLAVAGKGGAGKSVIAATVARLLAREGRKVLALDSDMLPGLSLSLGAQVPAVPPLVAAAEQDDVGRWRLRKGVGPVRAVQRYTTVAPDGVRLLQAGKNGPEGLAPVMGAVHAFHAVIHRIGGATGLHDWAVVGDLSAGPRQPAFDWAPYADRLLIVVEPTWQSMLTARRIVRIVTARREVETLLVVNKVGGVGDVTRVQDELGLPALGAVPADEGVRSAERLGVALLDHAPRSPAVAAIEELVRRLAEVRLGRS